MADCGFCTALQINTDREDNNPVTPLSSVHRKNFPEAKVLAEECDIATSPVSSPKGAEPTNVVSEQGTSAAQAATEPPLTPSVARDVLKTVESGSTLGIQQELREPVTSSKRREDPTAENPTATDGERVPMETTYTATAQTLTVKVPDPPVVKPVEEVVVNQKHQNERDFDTNPTELYIALQRKEWGRATECIQKNPEDVSTWISRKEVDGRLRWRLLPIHGSVVFNAPESIVSSLLAVYPDGASAKDDQGMVPLHLSLRVGSPENIIGLLLAASPESVDIKDRKGRTPKMLAQSAKSPKKENFLRALERGPNKNFTFLHRPKTQAEDEADARVTELRRSHEAMVESMKQDAEKKQKEMEETITNLQAELEKTQETSQVLVDHITSLEAQLSSRGETERFMASKIATLETNMKNSNKSLEGVEAQYKDQIKALTEAKEQLEEQNKTVQAEKERVTLELRSALDAARDETKKLRKAKQAQDTDMVSLEREAKNLRENVILLEDQISNGADTQRALADQVTALAKQLAHTREEHGKTLDAFATRVRKLEGERADLRFTVGQLTGKLMALSGFVKQIVADQDAVIEDVSAQDKDSEAAAEGQEQLMSELKEQELCLLRAREERDKIAAALVFQMEQIEKITQSRSVALEASQRSTQQMQQTSVRRSTMLRRVTDSKAAALEMLETTFIGMPTETLEKDVVDQVTSSIVASREIGQGNEENEGSDVAEAVSDDTAAEQDDEEAFESQKTPEEQFEVSIMENAHDPDVVIAPLSDTKDNETAEDGGEEGKDAIEEEGAPEAVEEEASVPVIGEVDETAQDDVQTPTTDATQAPITESAKEHAAAVDAPEEEDDDFMTTYEANEAVEESQGQDQSDVVPLPTGRSKVDAPEGNGAEEAADAEEGEKEMGEKKDEMGIDTNLSGVSASRYSFYSPVSRATASFITAGDDDFSKAAERKMMAVEGPEEEKIEEEKKVDEEDIPLP